MTRDKKREKGSNIVEFTLAGIPVIFLIYSTIQLGIAMWNYHTLAYAVNEGAHYAAVRGQGCTQNGNTCSTTVGTLAQQIATAAIGISPDRLNITLTTASGRSQTCYPLSSCFSNTTTWPPASNQDNQPGKNVTVAAQYLFPSGLAMLWPGAGSTQIGSVALPAKSTQLIVF
jgi:Flp pilus assembly protein TadG